MLKRILVQEYDVHPKLLNEKNPKQLIKFKKKSILPSKSKSPKIIRNKVKLKFQRKSN